LACGLEGGKENEEERKKIFFSCGQVAVALIEVEEKKRSFFGEREIGRDGFGGDRHLVSAL
jgi:hypothetical protein